MQIRLSLRGQTSFKSLGSSVTLAAEHICCNIVDTGTYHVGSCATQCLGNLLARVRYASMVCGWQTFVVLANLPAHHKSGGQALVRSIT